VKNDEFQFAPDVHLVFEGHEVVLPGTALFQEHDLAGRVDFFPVFDGASHDLARRPPHGRRLKKLKPIELKSNERIDILRTSTTLSMNSVPARFIAFANNSSVDSGCGEFHSGFNLWIRALKFVLMRYLGLPSVYIGTPLSIASNSSTNPS
jgi:hypothetical protein